MSRRNSRVLLEAIITRPGANNQDYVLCQLPGNHALAALAAIAASWKQQYGNLVQAVHATFYGDEAAAAQGQQAIRTFAETTQIDSVPPVPLSSVVSLSDLYIYIRCMALAPIEQAAQTGGVIAYNQIWAILYNELCYSATAAAATSDPEFYKACNNLAAYTTPGGWGSPGHVGMKVVQPTDLNVPLSFQVNTDRGAEYGIRSHNRLGARVLTPLIYNGVIIDNYTIYRTQSWLAKSIIDTMEGEFNTLVIWKNDKAEQA